MEASEKPTDQQTSTVRAIDGRLVIEHLEVDDERAARVVRERAESGQPPAETIAKSIEIGARVIDSEGIAINVDYVRGELERSLGSLGKELAASLEAGDEAIAERIASTFGPERAGSVQHQIRQILAEENERNRSALLRQFTAADGSNPLADFKDGVVRDIRALRLQHEREREADREQIGDLRGEIVALREKLGAKEEIEEERARGTAKGRTFEEGAFEAIERIASARGDAALHVGDDPGTAGSKKGDVVVELGAAEGAAIGTMVFEVKDSRLGKPKAWAELNGALDARSASFAVLVVAGEQNIPPGQQELHEYEGNKLIVAVDPVEPAGRSLELAYRYARCRVLLSQEGELSMDAAAVRDATAEAIAVLGEARGIKSALTTARKGVDRAGAGVETMVGAILERLERIESLVGESE